MQHTPAPTATDIEMMFLGRQPTTTQPVPAPVAPSVPAPILEPFEPLADYTALERATIRRRWLAHFAALVEYAERAVWLAIILSGLVVLVA